MEELQTPRQHGIIAYFSGTKLVTRIKKSMHSSHKNALSPGTAHDTTSWRDNAEQDEVGLTGSSEIGEATGSAEIEGEARAQADVAGPAHGATTTVPQLSKSLIPQPAKHLSAAAAVKKRYQYA